MKICVCGGGNLGHVCAGFIAAKGIAEVNVLTRRPQSWQQTLDIVLPEGDTISGPLSLVTNDAKAAVHDVDVVLICLPGMGIAEELRNISPYLSPTTAVGTVVSNTGFFFFAHDILPASTPLFGLQRVPFISRIEEYGKKANLLGRKDQLKVCVEHTATPQQLLQVVEQLFQTPTEQVDNFLEVSLSNSNPLLHTARLFDLWNTWKEGETYATVPLFYADWTDNASSLYVAMDGELQNLIRQIGLSKDAIVPVLEYYESADVPALTRKIRSIPAFAGILSPMKAVEGGYIPDRTSRYFIEDFEFGLKFARQTAKEHNVPTPTMDKVFDWYEKKMKL